LAFGALLFKSVTPFLSELQAYGAFWSMRNGGPFRRQQREVRTLGITSMASRRPPLSSSPPYLQVDAKMIIMIRIKPVSDLDNANREQDAHNPGPFPHDPAVTPCTTVT
jgi:hypothetical protein